MNKKEFLKELAKRANFTLKDVKLIWKCIEDIFEDAVRSRTELNIYGLGKLYFTKYPKRKGYDTETEEYIDLPETERVSFKISSRYKNMIKK